MPIFEEVVEILVNYSYFVVAVVIVEIDLLLLLLASNYQAIRMVFERPTLLVQLSVWPPQTLPCIEILFCQYPSTSTPGIADPSTF